MGSLNNQIDRKFTKSIQLDGYEILTDTGWQPLTHLHKTIPYTKFTIKTKNYELVCADNHILFAEEQEIFAKDTLHKKIQTQTGLEEVLEVMNSNQTEEMYDLSVNSKDHRYFTNGLLSHNTTCSAGYLLWYAMFHPDSTILICANKFSTAAEIIKRAKFAYEEMPDIMKSGVKVYNRHSIEFDNGSSIVIRATTPDAGRGLSISLLYVDEFAFVKPKMSREFWASISPTLSTGGHCIITSTPNSDEDQFAELWYGAINTLDEYGNERPRGIGKNGFKSFKGHYSMVPGRDEEWVKKEIESLGLSRFTREHECKFVTESDTLIDPMFLPTLKHKEPILTENNVRWFGKFNATSSYVIGLDPSLGVRRDNSVIEVFQMPEMIQIGEWYNNNTNTDKQTQMLQYIVNFICSSVQSEFGVRPDIYYTFENNSYGEGVKVALDFLGEDKINGVLINEQRAFSRGLNTNARTKNLALTRFKNFLESGRLTVNSKKLISELKAFVSKGGSFAARQGDQDDCVMATVLCVRLMQILTDWDEKYLVVMSGMNAEQEEEFIEPMPIIFG